MRIALVHYTYRPVIAGVELVMAEHARLFAADGHEVTVLCGSGATATPGERVLALRELDTAQAPQSPHLENETAASSDGADFASSVQRVKAALQPLLAAQDVVFLHNVLTMHFHLALTAALWEFAIELPRVRFVSWIHDLAACNPDYAPLPLDRSPWHLLACAHPSMHHIAVSELRRRQFAELTGHPASAIRVVPNGVEPGEMLRLPPTARDFVERHALLAREIVLLHPARLLRRKNIETTLRVTAALKAAGRSCAAVITAPPDVQNADSTAYEAELRKLKHELDLDADVFFLGDEAALATTDISWLFQLADALFFPSHQEGFGIPLLEAALHRLPIFCSEIEPLTELLPRGATTFPPEADPSVIAHLIMQKLDADPAWHARQQTLRDYSWRAIYRNVLSPLLAEMGRSPKV